jgi:hypothetical protein
MSSIVANTRNQMVAGARDMKADKLLMIDSDIVFPVNTLATLLAHDKPVVGGLYKRRTAPHEILGEPWDGTGDYTGLTRMRAVPTGCLLIDMSVFDRLPRPYFRFGVSGDMIVGEDIQFSLDCAEAGIELWADCDLELGHIGEQVIR